MVSYRQLNQFGIKQTVLHERETTSSGRPKAIMLQGEDQFFWYEYNSRGGLIQKKPKPPINQYAYWHKYNVKFMQTDSGNKRITPLTEFERKLGVKLYIETTRYNGKIYSQKEWNDYHTKHGYTSSNPTIDYGNVEYLYSTDLPRHLGQGNYNWSGYFSQKALKMNLITVDLGKLDFKEKQKPAVVEKVRPNPKEKSIASVKIEKPEPIEPIEEVAKYSPLMIAGVIAVVVILLLKRRRA